MKYALFSIALAVSWVTPAVVDAGCAIEVKFKNKSGQNVTVRKDKSKVSVKTGTGISVWKKFMASDVSLNPEQDKTHATSLALPCAAGMRKFKFYYETADGSSHWEKKNWVAIPVDRKISVKLK